MMGLDLSYYAGLLSAAQFHGAAHQRPQEFQVFLAKNRRSIQCGTVRVAFLARKRRRGARSELQYAAGQLAENIELRDMDVTEMPHDPRATRASPPQ